MSTITGQNSVLVRPMRSLSTMLVEEPRSAPFRQRLLGIHPDGTSFVERLRMDLTDSSTNAGASFDHVPVMLDEVVESFRDVPEGVVIDGTLGGAGHASALLDAHPQLSILGIDRDIEARTAAVARLARFGRRAAVRAGTFDQMKDLVQEAFAGREVVGVLLDLGVSSHQIDSADRGFSYRQSGPLDMRMNQSAGLSADSIVNDYEFGDLVRVLRDGGEEKFAARVAKAIVAARPIDDTDRLADVVRNAIPAPARRRPGDPAKRTFQALRLEVNDELPLLERTLHIGIELIKPAGRFVVLAYHSGEDRIVKQRFVEAFTGGCICPPQLPCACGARSVAKLLTRGARKAGAVEIERNPRAASVRLRAIELTGPVSRDNQR